MHWNCLHSRSGMENTEGIETSERKDEVEIGPWTNAMGILISVRDSLFCDEFRFTIRHWPSRRDLEDYYMVYDGCGCQAIEPIVGVFQIISSDYPGLFPSSQCHSHLVPIFICLVDSQDQFSTGVDHEVSMFNLIIDSIRSFL